MPIHYSATESTEGYPGENEAAIYPPWMVAFMKYTPGFMDCLDCIPDIFVNHWIALIENNGITKMQLPHK